MRGRNARARKFAGGEAATPDARRHVRQQPHAPSSSTRTHAMEVVPCDGGELGELPPRAEIEAALLGGAAVLFTACTPSQARSYVVSSYAAKPGACALAAMPDAKVEELQEELPAWAAWRTAGDVLALLPPEAEPKQVAQLTLGPGHEKAQEDVRGCVWYNLVASGSKAGLVRWIIVPVDQRARAVAEWTRRGGAGWPTAEELMEAGVERVRTAETASGQALALPPGALAVSCAGPGGASIVQWCRALAAPAEVPATYHEPSLPSAEAPSWRRVQRHPPVALASFLSLAQLVREREAGGGRAVEDVRAADDDNARARAPRSADLPLLLAAVRRSVEAEWLAEESAAKVELLTDCSPRVCDHCSAEIFNRCVRLDDPMRRADGEHGEGFTPHAPTAPNPRRENSKQRAKGAPGDFCLRAPPEPARALALSPPPPLPQRPHVIRCSPPPPGRHRAPHHLPHPHARARDHRDRTNQRTSQSAATPTTHARSTTHTVHARTARAQAASRQASLCAGAWAGGWCSTPPQLSCKRRCPPPRPCVMRVAPPCGAHVALDRWRRQPSPPWNSRRPPSRAASGHGRSTALAPRRQNSREAASAAVVLLLLAAVVTAWWSTRASGSTSRPVRTPHCTPLVHHCHPPLAYHNRRRRHCPRTRPAPRGPLPAPHRVTRASIPATPTVPHAPPPNRTPPHDDTCDKLRHASETPTPRR